MVSSSEKNNENNGSGTFLSATFNLLSSMVGGGSLSLPLAFSDIGIGLSGPILVVVSSVAADYSMRMLIQSSKRSNSITYESLVEDAFGSYSKYACQGIVFSLCFITCIGYGIILRDLSSPLVHLVYDDSSGVSLVENGAMLCIIVVVTPLCCLKTLTSLKNVGILSMASAFIMCSCVTYRSIQCNFYSDQNYHTFSEYLTWSKWNFESYLNALPLIVSVFVCHFNVLPVYIELQHPSNVNWLIRSTMFIACVFYITIGFWGSMYGNCLQSQQVSGNILLDFEDDDPLVLIARICLGVTVICMYPMLVNPARNILMHMFKDREESTLTQPLLDEDNQETIASPLFQSSSIQLESSQEDPNDKPIRILSAILVLWTAAFLACFIKTLDTVWDLLGSSFSILVGYLLPSLVYIYVSSVDGHDGLFWIAVLGVCVFTPMMILCTANSVYNSV